MARKKNLDEIAQQLAKQFVESNNASPANDEEIEEISIPFMGAQPQEDGLEEQESANSNPEKEMFETLEERPNDERIFEGGPYLSQVEAWKKQYGEIYATNIGDNVYIWRTLTRAEYKQIMALPNTNPLIREEMICQLCVLYPENFTYDVMASQGAGIPAVLAQEIMNASGFTDQYSTIKL